MEIMTQEDKELLLKDLCGRLLYGVKGIVEDGIKVTTPSEWPVEKSIEFSMRYMVIKNGWKPYLFPLSSMTEEQKKEYNFWKHEVPVCHYEYGDVVEEIELFDSPESFEYLIENHFDYRGLIPKGLAIDATGLNIY